MAIKIKAFGVVRSILGREEMDYPYFEELDDLLDKLKHDYPELNRHNFVVAINQQVVNENDKLADGDELALMPPFAGG